MHIHILGVCGTFMGGIAAIAKAAGHTVTGCDENVYPPMSTQLEALGVRIEQGFGADQLALNPDIYVIGNVAKRGVPLVEAILDSGARYTSGPQWLAEQILPGKAVIAVAGTHGKTTTAAMVAWLAEVGGLKPSFLIGGVPENFGVSARLTTSRTFVIEADEYDTAFFDKRSKFVHYRTKIGVLNNLEFDHADIFKDLAAIETQFHHLVRTVPQSGRLIANGRDAAIDRVLAMGCWTPVERFGDGAEWSAGNVESEQFEVTYRGEHQGRVKWSLLGAHNRANALAAIAAANAAGVAPAVSIEALARFKNVKRRMELRGVERGVSVYDDFAHHPTAIATTIAGLRAKVGASRIIAVLEPRSNTMKAGVMKALLAPSLAGADRVFCSSAGLDWDPAEALAPLGAKVVVEGDFDPLVARIASEARAGDQVLVMSNGGFNGIHAKLLAQLRAH